MSPSRLLLTACTLALPLVGQSTPLELEAGRFQPTGTWPADFAGRPFARPEAGWAAGLSWALAPGHRHQGRLHLGWLQTGRAAEGQVSYGGAQPLPAGQRMLGRPSWRAITVGFDWLPHLRTDGLGAYLLLGAHGVKWTRQTSDQHAAPEDPSLPPTYALHTTSNVLPGLLLTAGAGYRFTSRMALEVRAGHTIASASSDQQGAGVTLALAFRP